MLENSPHDRSTGRVDGLVVRAVVEIADRGRAETAPFGPELHEGVFDFLADNPRVVLREHAVDIAVQRAGTGLFVGCLDEFEVHAAVHQFFDKHPVLLVAADAIPTQANHARVLALEEHLRHDLKLWPLDLVGDLPVGRKLQLRRFVSRVFLCEKPTLNYAFNADVSDFQLMNFRKLFAGVDLVRDRIFLVHGIVRALAGVDQVLGFFVGHMLMFSFLTAGGMNLPSTIV